jgi:tRNA G37 N-methylase TrmD
LKIQFAKITSGQDETINKLKRELAELEKTNKRMELSHNESQKKIENNSDFIFLSIMWLF